MGKSWPYVVLAVLVLCAPLALVNKELESLIDKLGARSRTEACIAAMQEGLIA